MASIRREIVPLARPEDIWDALWDVGAPHIRLVPGFVTHTEMDGSSRIVTFFNGMTVRERIVAVDEQQRRVVWSAVGGTLTHHNGSAQVFPEGSGSRIVWIADLLPDEMADRIAMLMDEGMKAMKAALDRTRLSLTYLAADTEAVMYSSYGPLKSSMTRPSKCQIRVPTSSIRSWSWVTSRTVPS